MNGRAVREREREGGKERRRARRERESSEGGVRGRSSETEEVRLLLGTEEGRVSRRNQSIQ